MLFDRGPLFFLFFNIYFICILQFYNIMNNEKTQEQNKIRGTEEVQIALFLMVFLWL